MNHELDSLEKIKNRIEDIKRLNRMLYPALLKLDEDLKNHPPGLHPTLRSVIYSKYNIPLHIL
jgi:hypothetical protein